MLQVYYSPVLNRIRVPYYCLILTLHFIQSDFQLRDFFFELECFLVRLLNLCFFGQ